MSTAEIDNQISTSYGLGCAFLTALASPMLMVSASWAMGAGVMWWMLPLAVVVSALVLWGVTKSVKAEIAFLVYIVVATVVSGVLFDNAYDSNAYHKVTAYMLAEGWNPISELDFPGMNLWSLHYGRMLETFGALVYATTGVLEQGKVVNLLLVGALATLSYDFLRWRGCQRRRALTLTAVVLCNPVLLTQVFTFYIDYASYVFSALSIIMIIEMVCRRRQVISLAALTAVTVLAIGSKFNAFFYQGVVLISAIAWLLCRKDTKDSLKLVGVGVVSLAIGALVFYHPYITNWVNWGNPLYPLLGADSVDIMTSNTPEIYDGHNRLVNMLISLSHTPGRTGIFVNYDSRVGGFTLAIIPLLIMSALMAWRGRHCWPGVTYYIMAVSLVSCFVFEQGWWARYIPQLWLVPSVATVGYALYSPVHRAINIILVILYVITSLLSGVAMMGATIQNTYRLWQTREAMETQRVEIVEPSASDQHLLRTWGIDYSAVDTLEVAEAGIFGGHAPFGFKDKQ